MVQSGDDYREKNKIRLQRFYEKQKQQGKKRVSALVSDEAYQLLTDQKDQAGESMSTLIDQAVMVAYGEHGIPDIVSDEAYARLMDAKEHTGESLPMLIDRAVMAAYGDQGQDILDIDDPALNEEVITNFEGPGQDGIPFEDVESDTSLVDQKPDTAQADASTHVETDTDTQEPEIIPDCAGRTITIEERDRILLQLAEKIPGRKSTAVQARVDLLNEKGIPVTLKPGQYGGEWTRKKFTDTLRDARKRQGEK